MAINFPDSPSVNQIYSTGGTSWRWTGTKWVASGVTNIVTIGDTPPTTPIAGSNWFDSTEGNLYLWYVDPTGPGQWVPATNAVGLPADIASQAASSQNNVGRNYIQNSLFNVLQRGLGPWSTSGYTADRWYLLTGGGDTATAAIQAAPDSARTAISDDSAQTLLQNVWTGSAAAGAVTLVQQPIENVRRLAGKTITVSFWATASAALKIGINGFQTYGTGGSPSAFDRWQATGASVNVTTVWQRFVVTFTVPTSVGKTLGTNGDHSSWLQLFYSSGATNNAIAGNIGVQSGTVYLWGVQLEVGSSATPLEKIDPGDDFRRCQRFYQTGIVQNMGVSSGVSTYTSIIPFPVTMRAAATMTASFSTQNNATGSVNPQPAGYGYQFNINVTVVAGNGVNVFGTWTASADL